MNLLGQYEITVGDKGRIALPKKIRENLGEKIIITYGFERSLIVVKESKWGELIEELKTSSLFATNARSTKRFLFGGAVSLDLDKQGRFILPDFLYRYSEIKKEVVFVGLSSYAEIWGKEVWDEYTKNVEKQIEKIAESLVKKIEE